jgi:hypothetical protein
MTRRILVVLATLAALAALMLPVTASAAEYAGRGAMFGPRFGVSVDPDQLVLGGQFVTAELAPHLTFVPNLELGLGDHQTVVALNMDGHYHLTLHDSDWVPYVGFGVAVNFVSVDRPAPFEDDSDTDVGGNFILGTTVPTRSRSLFFTELKLGVGDGPSLKVLAGWNFPLR